MILDDIFEGDVVLDVPSVDSESLLTTRRTWRFANGRTEQGTMRRRFWSVDALDRCARTAGFEVLPAGPAAITLCARMPKSVRYPQ